MGALCSGPRDALDVHKTALVNASEGAPASKVKAYFEEGRYLILELMGRLLSFYRNFYPGAGDAPLSKVLRDRDPEDEDGSGQTFSEEDRHSSERDSWTQDGPTGIGGRSK